jgi:hypothetical protein
MGRRRRTTITDESGYDSFLDIVANLVGILVILIMVVGVRARNAFRSTTAAPVMSSAMATPVPTARPDSVDALEQQVLAKKTEVQELQRDTFRLDAQIEQVGQQAMAWRAERDQLQLLVAAANADLAERRAALSDTDQARNQTNEQIAAARHELQQIGQTILAVEAAAPDQPKLLTHFPTPLAKMVFGREEHFRLMDRRLVYVPINMIVEELRNDAEKKLWKLKETDEITETIGPFGGFRVRYTMQRRQRRVQTEAGPSLRRTIELAKFTLFPIGERMGQPLATALTEGSEFMQFIKTLDPTDTTITVWTYPDSFEDYRGFKDVLQSMGFQSAARPMPAGHPIGGSPSGSRSAAE